VAPVGVPGGVEGGVEGGVAGGIVGGVVGDETAKSAAQLRTVRVPQPILMGNAISRTEPAYPAIARRARVSGLVVIQVTVGTDGSVKGARVVSGHPMLVQSALDAVRKWRFRPYLVNGNVVEVESNITLVFRLAP
jgi:protein TonB